MCRRWSSHPATIVPSCWEATPVAFLAATVAIGLVAMGKIDRAAIFERDGYVCQLCGMMVAMDRKEGDPGGVVSLPRSAILDKGDIATRFIRH